MIEYGWLKTLLKTLVDRGSGANISGCRGMEVGTEADSCQKVLGVTCCYAEEKW